MRWDDLFADLEGQLAAEERRLALADVADRVRLERARVCLADRLAHGSGREEEVTLLVAGGLQLAGTLTDAGLDWVRLRTGTGEAVVPVAAVVTVAGLGPWASPVEGDVRRRFGLGQVLRALSRDRAHVRVHTVAGSEHEGRVERVGADHLTLVETGELVRARRSRGELTVAWAAIAAVRST